MSDDNPPTAKYRYTLQITGNTLEEIEADIERAATEIVFIDRDEFAIQGGTAARTLIIADPAQTPEKYLTDLEAWMNARKAARRDA